MKLSRLTSFLLLIGSLSFKLLLFNEWSFSPCNIIPLDSSIESFVTSPDYEFITNSLAISSSIPNPPLFPKSQAIDHLPMLSENKTLN